MKEFLVVNTKHHPRSEIFFGEKTPHAEVPARVLGIEKALHKLSEAEIVYPQEFTPLPIDLLRQVHDSDYVDFVLRSKGCVGSSYRYPSSFPYRRATYRSTNVISELGYYAFDLYTPINRFTGKAALLSASAAFNAAMAILAGDKAAYSVARPPGHHAGYDYMGGYCYFNNAALATHILREHGKVGIIDVDFHHGNGTEDIVKLKHAADPNPQTLYVSIHAHPNRKFPYSSGVENVFNSCGRQLSFNYPLGQEVKNRQYARALDKALQDVQRFKTEFLVVSLGFDTHKDDPICDFALTTDYYEEMARSLMSLHLPTVFTQEGGYNLDTIGSIASSFIKGVTSSL